MAHTILSVGLTSQASAAISSIGTYYSNSGESLIVNLISYLSAPSMHAALIYDHSIPSNTINNSLGFFWYLMGAQHSAQLMIQG